MELKWDEKWLLKTLLKIDVIGFFLDCRKKNFFFADLVLYI